MQSYLGEYPGSRENSDKKFLRAVESFINQTDKDSELVIVSDGCEITHRLYYKHFKSNDRIKYVYVDKDTPNMYEGEKKFFRGLPREIGRVVATGEVISYMDSKYFWNKHPEKDWGINVSWYDNIHRKNNPIPHEEKLYEDSSNEDEIKIKGLESKWYAVKGKPNSVPMQPTVLSHKNHVKTKWRDTTGRSEDIDFNQRIRKEYSNGFKYIDPMYVRCHYSNRWDY
jgi:hypothetical protein